MFSVHQNECRLRCLISCLDHTFFSLALSSAVTYLLYKSLIFRNRQLNSINFQAWKMKFLNSMTFQIFHDLYEPCLNKINNRIHVKITCRIFGPSFNNITTVNDANHTKGFIFKIIDSLTKNMREWKPVSSIQSCFNTSCFDTKSSSENSFM